MSSKFDKELLEDVRTIVEDIVLGDILDMEGNRDDNGLNGWPRRDEVYRKVKVIYNLLQEEGENDA